LYKFLKETNKISGDNSVDKHKTDA